MSRSDDENISNFTKKFNITPIYNKNVVEVNKLHWLSHKLVKPFVVKLLKSKREITKDITNFIT